jgi:CelD/BcsL family acetyltransferase involved in cellulose biosynthesis
LCFVTSITATRHIFCLFVRVQPGVLQVNVCKSAQELVSLRPVWERLCCPERTTIFQDFDFNLLAARMFAGRETPYVVCARASYGEAIIPAALSCRNGLNCIRLLGEELFDYRNFLWRGDDEVLRSALSALAHHGCQLAVTALRESDCRSVPQELELSPFSAAPEIRCKQVSEDVFSRMHLRLARNLRRLERLGFELKTYDGDHRRLLQAIYHNKAAQDSQSLFHDPLRLEFIVNAALLQPHRFEIFTLETPGRLGAALVTLLDAGVRRFYTGWFSPELSKHSPSLSLIYEVTKRSLAAGLDCDYMTGEQPYKLRLASSSVPLFRIYATSKQLAAMGEPAATELRIAS